MVSKRTLPGNQLGGRMCCCLVSRSMVLDKIDHTFYHKDSMYNGDGPKCTPHTEDVTRPPHPYEGRRAMVLDKVVVLIPGVGIMDRPKCVGGLRCPTFTGPVPAHPWTTGVHYQVFPITHESPSMPSSIARHFHIRFE
jgi:hypothetical protein